MKFYKGMIPWNKGLKGKHHKKQKFCLDCGTEIKRHDALRCKSCSHKGERNINSGGLSEIHRKNLSEACKGRVSGFKGHHHTTVVKEKMSIKRQGIKKPDFCGNNNPTKRPEVQQKMRKPHPSIAGKNHPCFGKTMKPHFIQYKNKWFRSNWEVTLAKELDSKSIKWQYESKTFNLGNTTYTPDFYLVKTKEYIEVVFSRT
jgi:hypothetical protein